MGEEKKGERDDIRRWIREEAREAESKRGRESERSPATVLMVQTSRRERDGTNSASQHMSWHHVIT